jgi:hypothetical protein
MCFSAEADLATGVVIGAIGCDALFHVRRPAERLLAALPVVLAAHQLIEAVVWWHLEGHFPNSVGRTATWLYLAVAFGVLPVLVPSAVAAMEPAVRRRRLLAFSALGIAVAVVLMYAVVRGPVRASVDGHHIAYQVDLWHGGLIVAGYVVATACSMAFSTHRYVRWFGVANLLAAIVLAWLVNNGLISLWCVWAAITSAGIAAHLRRGAFSGTSEGAFPGRR